MQVDFRRITLIARSSASPLRNWDITSSAPSRIIAMDNLAVLQYALRNAMTELNRDVDRVILDRATTATQYLDLLSTVPLEFNGDIVMVRYDDSGFLSAVGRGGDRVLYSLDADDLRFYLAANQLVSAPILQAVPMPVPLPMKSQMPMKLRMTA